MSAVLKRSRIDTYWLNFIFYLLHTTKEYSTAEVCCKIDCLQDPLYTKTPCTRLRCSIREHCAAMYCKLSPQLLQGAIAYVRQFPASLVRQVGLACALNTQLAVLSLRTTAERLVMYKPNKWIVSIRTR